MPQQVACSRDFGKQGYDIGNVRDIYARVGHIWVVSGILPLVKARLGLQTLAAVREQMRFQVLSNEATGVSDVRNYKSNGS